MDASTVACPACGKQYVWKIAFLGNELSCKCGRQFRAIAPPGAMPKTEEPETPAKLPGSSKSPILEALERREDEVKANRWMEYHIPVILLLVGWFGGLVILTQWLETREALMLVGIQTAMGLVVFTPLIFGAVIAVASVFEKPVGLLVPTTLKVLAIAIGLAPLSDIITVAMFNLVEGEAWVLLVAFAMYVPTVVAPAATFFKLDVHEAAAVGFIVYLAKAGVLLMAPVLLPGMLPLP